MLALLRRISIRTRLVVTVVLVVALVCVVGLLGRMALLDTSGHAEELGKRDVPALSGIATVASMIERNGHLTAQHLYVYDGDLANQDRLQKEIAANAQAVADDLAALRKLPLSRDALAALDAVDAARADYRAKRDAVIAASRAETVAGADDRSGSRDAYLGKVLPALDVLAKAFARFEEVLGGEASRSVAQADSASSSGILRMEVGTAAAVLAAIVAATLLILSITRPLRRVLVPLRAVGEDVVPGLERGLAAMADGDMTRTLALPDVDVDVSGRDELTEASRAIAATAEAAVRAGAAYERTRAALGTLLGGVADASTALSTASGELASAAEETGRAIGDVATGAERQSAMATDALRLAEASREGAGAGAEATSDAAERVRGVATAIGEVDAAMAALRDRSSRIGGIVSTIRELADQTSLLALNAAIEAARAGDLGRGFAVVADEVGRLADQSTTAASEIGDIVAEMQERTDDAVRSAERTAAQVGDVVAAIERASAAFATIVEGSGAVARSLDEVAAVATENSAATEEVSATTEETASGAATVADTAESLRRQLERFTVHGA